MRGERAETENAMENQSYNASRMRIRALLIVLLCAVFAAPASFATAQTSSTGRAVDIVELNGVLDSVMGDYLISEIAAANRRGSELLVIQVDSRGGLDVSTAALVASIESSAVPIAVYVGPQRARAGGSAAVLLAAAHVAVIGPSARIGPIHPTNLAVRPNSARGRRLRSGTAALLERLGSLRGRGGASSFLDRSISQEQAVAAGAVDFPATSVAELLTRANGRAVETSPGLRTLRLASSEVVVRFHKPGPIPRLLHTLAVPSLVYILLVAGLLLVVFEIFQPGFGVAGVTGALLLVGAAYGLIVLPISPLAIAALIAGSALLAFDVGLHGLGPPTVAGMILFTLGSMFLFPGPAGELRIPRWLIGTGVGSAAVFFVPVMTMVRRARQPVGTMARQTLVGRTGQVRSILNPEGYVWVDEALWRARCEEAERLRVGEDVLVVGVEGLVLTVRRA
jgi:membrane-bound serine protease (ClpP class)